MSDTVKDAPDPNDLGTDWVEALLGEPPRRGSAAPTGAPAPPPPLPDPALVAAAAPPQPPGPPEPAAPPTPAEPSVASIPPAPPEPAAEAAVQRPPAPDPVATPPAVAPAPPSEPGPVEAAPAAEAGGSFADYPNLLPDESEQWWEAAGSEPERMEAPPAPPAAYPAAGPAEPSAGVPAPAAPTVRTLPTLSGEPAPAPRPQQPAEWEQRLLALQAFGAEEGSGLPPVKAPARPREPSERKPGTLVALVAVGVLVLLVTLAGVTQLGGGSTDDSELDAQQRLAPVSVAPEPTVPAVAGPVFADVEWTNCDTISRLRAQVDSDAGVAEVEIVGADPNGTRFRREMSEREGSPGSYVVDIGPLGGSGDLTYHLVAEDADGNTARTDSTTTAWDDGC